MKVMGRLTQVFIIGLMFWIGHSSFRHRQRILESLNALHTFNRAADALNVYISAKRGWPPSWDALSQYSGSILSSNDLLECKKLVRINFDCRDGLRLIELSMPSNDPILNEEVEKRNNELDALLYDLGKEVSEFVERRSIRGSLAPPRDGMRIKER